MAPLTTCCGNQPTPIFIGLFTIVFLFTSNEGYPLYGQSTPSNLNLGHIVYRPQSTHPRVQLTSSSHAPLSIVSPPSSSATRQSPSLASTQQQGNHFSPSSSSSSSSSLPEITFIQPALEEENNLVNRRPIYHDYLDTFRLPLINSVRDKIPAVEVKQPPIDFDYVPYLTTSDLNPLPIATSQQQQQQTLSSALLAAAAAAAAEGRLTERDEPYEEPDYVDPVYDPIEESKWLSEPTSYQHQPVALSSPDSDEVLTNLIVNYLVQGLEKNAQSQSEPIQHSPQFLPDEPQPINEGTKNYEGYMEKKSMNRDKGTSSSATTTTSSPPIKPTLPTHHQVITTRGPKKGNDSLTSSARGQKEFPMLRPSTENNGKDDLDSSQGASLTSQLRSLSSSPGQQTDEEVNQLRSLVQSL